MENLELDLLAVPTHPLLLASVVVESQKSRNHLENKLSLTCNIMQIIHVINKANSSTSVFTFRVVNPTSVKFQTTT